MSLVNTKEMFKKASQGKYAIGAFNINNMEIIQAITRACAKQKSDLILQTSTSAVKYMGTDYIKRMVVAASDETGVNIALHLDHGADIEAVKMCINAGFTSVMYDGSHLDFEENVRKTKEVVEYAHAMDVVVEAELGRLAGVEDELSVDSEDATYTNPDQALEFVERTLVDSLAIAIGTSHGAYKFAGDAKLDFARLELISHNLDNAGFKNYPIVLHGASSVSQSVVEKNNKFGANIKGAAGIPVEMLRKAASLSVCKINIDTDIRLEMTAAIREFLVENPDKFDPRAYLGLARDEIERMVEDKIINVLGSQNSK